MVIPSSFGWLCYIVIYSIINNTIINTQEDFFKKYISHFICNICELGAGDQTELQYIDPHSYGRQRCVFLVLQSCSTRGPEAQRPTLLGDGFLYCILSATSLDPNSSGAQRATSVWPGFPYHILSAALLQLQP